VPGDVIGVVMRLEHVFDADTVEAGKVEVGLDVPLRIDDRGDSRADVADQIGRASEVLVDHLSEKHRCQRSFLTKIVENESSSRIREDPTDAPSR
jgi:phosphopantothenate synthetase